MPISTSHASHRSPRSKWRLRTIFIIVNLSILILPLGGLFFFRIYENELLRQTEQELIAQAAFISALYRQELRDTVPADYGKPLANYRPLIVDERYTPVYPQLDLASHATLPPRPDASPGNNPADALAQHAAAKLYPALTEAQKTTLAGIKLLDFNGTVIAAKEDKGGSFAGVEEVEAALSGFYKSVIRLRENQTDIPPLASISRGTGIRVFVAYPIVENQRLWGIAYLSRTPQTILKHLYAEQEKVLLAGLTILLIALGMTLFTTYMVTRPIHRLIAQTKRVIAGDASGMAPLRRPATREVELLSESVVQMAQTLQSRGEYIREFATHVSHEFKTPLSGIRGATELLSEHMDTMTAEEQQKFLRIIAADTARLTRLVSRLLELARADNLASTGGTSDLRAVCLQMRAQYAPALTIDVEKVAAGQIAIAEENLEIILTNLLDNAHHHNATHVTLSSEVLQTTMRFRISDNGDGVSPANRDKVFMPFFTTRRESGGTGMGLGIVTSILSAHEGSITLEDSIEGATFTLDLPTQRSAQQV